MASAMKTRNPIMTVIFLFCVAFGCLALAGISEAANWYVCSGASGLKNGTDWVNGWTDVANINWNGVSAGDSIWIAGGNYGVLTIGKSGSSGSPIYIARVRTTDSVPTAAAGWKSSFDSTVTLSQVVNAGSYSYWTLDGRIPQPNAGLQIMGSLTVNAVEFYQGSANMSHITLTNLLISGSVTDNSMGGVNDVRCINFNGSASGYSISYLTLSYSELRDNNTLLSFLNMNNVTMVHNLFHNNYRGNSSYHPNVIQTIGLTYVTFAYNEITNWQDEGIMMDFISTGDAVNDHWYLYSNLWHDPMAPDTNYPRILESQYNPQTNIFFYQNTVVNLWQGILAGNGGSWASSCVSKNNIYYAYNASDNGQIGFGNSNDDYNLSNENNLLGSHSINNATSSIFTNFAGGVYTIVATVGAEYPRGKGVYLGSPYTTDFAGNTFTNPPSIGAYEYVGTTNNPPSPPKNLSIR